MLTTNTAWSGAVCWGFGEKGGWFTPPAKDIKAVVILWLWLSSVKEPLVSSHHSKPLHTSSPLFSLHVSFSRWDRFIQLRTVERAVCGVKQASWMQLVVLFSAHTPALSCTMSGKHCPTSDHENQLAIHKSCESLMFPRGLVCARLLDRRKTFWLFMYQYILVLSVLCRCRSLKTFATRHFLVRRILWTELRPTALITSSNGSMYCMIPWQGAMYSHGNYFWNKGVTTG